MDSDAERCAQPVALHYEDIERLRRSFRCFSAGRGAVNGLAFGRLVAGALVSWHCKFHSWLLWGHALCLSRVLFFSPPGEYSKNRYAILPRPHTAMVPRKGRRGRSKRQRRNANNAYQRRQLEVTARLMAGEAGKDNNMDINAEADAQKRAQPSADGKSKIFCFDESIFSHYSNQEIERLLIGPGRKRQIRRVKRQHETGKSRRACVRLERQASYLDGKVIQCLIGRPFTHWKNNTRQAVYQQGASQRPALRHDGPAIWFICLVAPAVSKGPICCKGASAKVCRSHTGVRLQ